MKSAVTSVADQSLLVVVRAVADFTKLAFCASPVVRINIFDRLKITELADNFAIYDGWIQRGPKIAKRRKLRNSLTSHEIFTQVGCIALQHLLHISNGSSWRAIKIAISLVTNYEGK